MRTLPSYCLQMPSYFILFSQISCALQALSFSAFLAKRSRTSSCKSHCFQTLIWGTRVAAATNTCWILKLANCTLMPHQVALDSHGNDDQTACNWSLGMRKELENRNFYKIWRKEQQEWKRGVLASWIMRSMHFRKVAHKQSWIFDVSGECLVIVCTHMWNTIICKPWYCDTMFTNHAM